MATKMADDRASLEAALETARAGDTVELAGGNYGDFAVSVQYGDPWARFAGEVTIRSADPDNPATFTGIDLWGAENLTFDGVVFDHTTEGSGGTGFRVRSGANITIRNSVFDGDVLDDPSSPYNGLPAGVGLFIRATEGVVVENNEFVNWYRGAVFMDSADIAVGGNEVHTIRSDGLVFVTVQDLVVEDNHIHDFVSRPGGNDHRDMIQFWTAGTDAPSQDIVIRDNIFNSGSGPWTQTIFMGNEEVTFGNAGHAMFYRNVTVENNVIYNGHLHGITLGAADGVKILNNTLLNNPEGGLSGAVSRPHIRVEDESRNVQITGNVAQAVSEPSGNSVNWKVSDNLLVQNTDPAKPNYYGALFVNALTGGGDLAALQALPGSLVEQGGYGSSLTRFNASPDALTAVISFLGETGNDVFAFDAGYTANGGGFLGDDDASFRWEMSDGTVLEGAEIEHAFRPGTHTVTLTATDGEGNSDTAQARIHVPEPVRLDLDVTAGGLVDGSAYGAGDLPSVRVQQDGGRYAARLTDSTGFGLERGASPLYDLNAFTISLDLKAAGGAASAGDIFRIHGSMLLSVEADGSFEFDFTNNAGEDFQLRSAPTSALNGGWHDVSVTYDKWSGSLALYVDGKEVGETAAGGPTKPFEHWGPHFGSIWGKTAFDGLIDDFEFRDDPLPGRGTAGAPAPEVPAAPPREQTPAPEPEPEDSFFDLAIAYDDGRLIDGHLADGEALALDDVDDGRVTLVATPAGDVGSVRMELDDTFEFVENVEPYALFGDRNGTYHRGTVLDAGEHEVTLTAYSGSNGRGDVLGSDTIVFSVADQPEPSPEAGVPGIDDLL